MLVITFVLLFISRFAIVSTGWNPKSSITPALAAPINRAVPLSEADPDAPIKIQKNTNYLFIQVTRDSKK